LLRCGFAEDPKGNRRRRYVTASAAGARVGKLREVEATGLYRGTHSGLWAGRRH
jgi:hypothetical protein